MLQEMRVHIAPLIVTLLGPVSFTSLPFAPAPSSKQASNRLLSFRFVVEHVWPSAIAIAAASATCLPSHICPSVRQHQSTRDKTFHSTNNGRARSCSRYVDNSGRAEGQPKMYPRSVLAR